MKQTAIDCLLEQLEGTDSKIARVIGLKKYNEIVQQAKQMEKEQIEDAYDQMRCIGNYENGKQYYNETYDK